MDKKKDFLLSVVGLAILLVGAVIVSVMDYPLGVIAYSSVCNSTHLGVIAYSSVCNSTHRYTVYSKKG